MKKDPSGQNLQITFPIEDQLKEENTNNVHNGLQTTLAPGFTGVIVDVHEPQVIPESLRRDKGLLIKVMSLKSGDYAFANVGIERKEFNDYMNSLTSGRLWEQMYNLKRTYERPILVVEGLKDPISQLAGNVSIRFVSSLSRIVLMGVSVVVLPTLAHFLSFIQYSYLSCGRQGLSMKPIPKKPWYREKEEIKEDLLCMCPGIGRKTAKAILARFPTFDKLMAADQFEIANTGLGKKRSQALWEILHT
jgi:Fanconi anemia group M protein